MVTDQTGAAVPGADVIVRNIDTNVSRNLRSNEAGNYQAVSLQPGNYEVKVSKAGFSTLTRVGVTVSVGQRAVIDVAIKVSGVAEDVRLLKKRLQWKRTKRT